MAWSGLVGTALAARRGPGGLTGRQPRALRVGRRHAERRPRRWPPDEARARLTSSYLLRWRRRPTPFGLFAGVTAASAAGEPTARFGRCHRVAARADAQWLGGLIDDLERHPGVLLRLPVVVNNAGFTRSDRFVVPARHDDAQPGRRAALDTSVRYTQAMGRVEGFPRPLPFPN